jgi:hypothetical protein
MPSRVLSLFCCLIVLSLSLAHQSGAQGNNPDFDSYSNAKYGYAVGYPKHEFLPQGESDAGDGQIFLSPDGKAELRVYGEFNVLDETLAARFQAALGQSGLQPNYKVLRKDWFVVSGMLSGKVFYQKTLQTKDAFYTLMLTYDVTAKSTYDPLVADIVKSFTIF